MVTATLTLPIRYRARLVTRRGERIIRLTVLCGGTRSVIHHPATPAAVREARALAGEEWRG